MAEPRMLVVDLDGTALDGERRLTARDVRAAGALARAGIPVTIATGRLFTGTRWVAQTLGVEGSVAVMNGSELVDVQSGVARHGRYLDVDVRGILRRELSKSTGHGTFLFASRRIYYGADHAHHAPYLALWTEDLSAHPDVFAVAGWRDAEDVVAVGVAGEHAALSDLRERLGEVLPADLDAALFGTLEGHGFLKIRHGAEDKGTALRRLAEERGLGLEHTVAVGDWINDLPMLEVAGRSFAMGHARDEVKAVAHEVLDATRAGGAIAEVAARVWGLSDP